MIKLGAHDTWTKSSYSTGNGACVEVKSAEAASVSVTDSKVEDTATRPVLSVSPGAFSALVDHVRV
jgi:Domain of unknown function (DUF397)